MKTKDILADFRQRIVSGEFGPGMQLPLRSSLAADYGASLETLQKVVNTLREEGFLENCGPNGTRVPAFAPHLYRIGVLFPMRRGSREIWDTFFEAFTLAMTECDRSRQTPYQFKPYYDIESHREESAPYLELLDDIANHRLAGLIALQHTTLPPNLMRDCRSLPLVVFSGLKFDAPNIITQQHDYFRLIELAGEDFRNEGRVNPAILTNTGHRLYYLPEWQAILRRYGFEIPLRQIQGVCLCPDAQEWYVQTLRLLFETDAPPDSLILLNENLLPWVTKFLEERKLKIPVISHCNFPATQSASPGVRRIGLDTREVLRLAIREISRWTRHEPISVHTVMPVRESEQPRTFDWI